MSGNLSSSVGVSFGPSGGAPFELGADGRDAADNRAFKYVPFAWKPEEFRQPEGVYYRQLETQAFGKTVLRLYAQAPAEKIVCLNPITTAEKTGFHLIGPGMGITLAPSGYAGRQIIFEGRRVDTIREELAFNGAAEARIRYADFATSAPAIIFASRFVDGGLAQAKAPDYTGGGLFRAKTQVHGSLVVEYPAFYFRYAVYYDIPASGLRLKYTVARGGGGKTAQGVIFGEYESLAAPSIMAVATRGERMARAEFTGEIFRWEFASKAGDGEADDDWAETGRETKIEKVYDPEDDSLFIEVERMTRGDFTGANGRSMRLKLKSD